MNVAAWLGLGKVAPGLFRFDFFGWTDQVAKESTNPKGRKDRSIDQRKILNIFIRTSL